MASTVLFILAVIALLAAIALFVAWMTAPDKKDGWIAPVVIAGFAGGLAIAGTVLQ